MFASRMSQATKNVRNLQQALGGLLISQFLKETD